MLQLIINADDFGLNKSCTEAIAQSFRQGLITDATMVANGEAFDEAARMAVREFDEKVGIHFNLTEGTPLTDGIKHLPAFCDKGVFHGRVSRLKHLSDQECKAVYDELSAQCIRLCEAGVNLVHADSHHHIHTAIFIAPIVMRVCKENGIDKIRLHRNLGDISFSKRAIKGIYNFLLRQIFKSTDLMGSADDIEISRIPSGIVEIMVHPDFDRNGNLIDRKGDGGSPMSTIKYWDTANKISYSDL